MSDATTYRFVYINGVPTPVKEEVPEVRPAGVRSSAARSNGSSKSQHQKPRQDSSAPTSVKYRTETVVVENNQVVSGRVVDYSKDGRPFGWIQDSDGNQVFFHGEGGRTYQQGASCTFAYDGTVPLPPIGTTLIFVPIEDVKGRPKAKVWAIIG